MRLKFALAAASAAAFVAASASAASITPTSYAFDQTTDCGSYCYRDAGVFTPNFTAEPATPYGELTDGVLGYAGWYLDGSTPWVGWTDSLVNIDFTFSQAYRFAEVSVGTTQDNLQDVVLPNLRVFSSANGVDWVLRGGLATPPSSSNNNDSSSTAPHVFLTMANLDFTSRYVRLEVTNQGPGYGTFSFLDEVRFDGRPASGSVVPEPGAWALMIAGFGLAGAGLRRRRTAAA